MKEDASQPQTITNMTREIKFRVWVTTPSGGYIVEDYACVNENGQILVEEGSYLHPLKFMQFTGLKDKNGKEIYEGDIISWDFDPEQKNEIVFQEGCFGHVNIMGINKEYREFVPIDKSRAGHMIVCGNIHENPELLANLKQ